MVVKALRNRDQAGKMMEHSLPENDRDLVECSIDCVVIRLDSIEVRLTNSEERSDAAVFQENGAVNSTHRNEEPTTLTLPWSAPSFAAVKGILHAPVQGSTMKPEARDALLTAIAKARRWIDDIVQGRVDSFAEIAKRDSKAERHIRLLAPLAFVSPQVVATINSEAASKDLTVTGLARTLPYRWDWQENCLKPIDC